jgi:hypothetical protein
MIREMLKRRSLFRLRWEGVIALIMGVLEVRSLFGDVEVRSFFVGVRMRSFFCGLWEGDRFWE